MTIYRVHPDRLTYQLLTISSDEILEKLGEAHPFHIDPTPKPYAHIWKPLDVSFYDSTSGNKKTLLPDITVSQGRIFINEAASEALSNLIENDGEILPVHFDGQDGAILNPLKIAENFDALDQKHSTKNEWGDLQSLSFFEHKLSGVCIFRSEFEGLTGVFCNEDFKKAVENAGIKGITFSEDLGNIFPPDPLAQDPVAH